ncbi:DUF4160 domain-containing protein [Pseudodesulfovibrio cashew]
MANSTDLELSLKKYLDSFLTRPSRPPRQRNTDFIVLGKNSGFVSGAKVEIRINEHAPPHFHVTINKDSASYAIKDCALLSGGLPQKTQKRLKQWYQNDGREKLIADWNGSRPSDCTVGKI